MFLHIYSSFKMEHPLSLYCACTGLAVVDDKNKQWFIQYDGQGVYWGLSRAFYVFLIFNNQLYSCLRNYNEIVFLS